MGDTHPAGFAMRLSGGRRQSTGASDAVAAEVREHPDRAAELWEAADSADRLVMIRAVDCLEKVSVTHPQILVGHERTILETFATSELAEVRWHLGLMLPRRTRQH